MGSKDSLLCSEQPAICPRLDPDESSQSHPMPLLTFSLILPYHLCLGLQSAFFPSDFPTKILYAVSLLSYTFHMPCPSQSPQFITRIVFSTEWTWWSLSFLNLCLLHCSAPYFETPQYMFVPESGKPCFAPRQRTGKIVVLCNKHTCCRNSLFRRTSHKCRVIYSVTCSERYGIPL
jgi:hypothetical protein